VTEDHRSKPIVDATEIALVTAGAIVGGPPGAALGVLGVLANKMLSPLERFRRARLARFLERVSHFLEENDPEGAAQFVSEHVTDEQFTDALDRGFEKMRRAFDPLAEECICVLVADHVRSGALTDRRFARAGNLLEVSDRAILTTINGICEAYVAATKLTGSGTLGIVFHSRGVPDKRGPFFFVAVYDRSKVIGISDNLEAPANFERVVLLLENHGFGETFRGLGEAPPRDRQEGGPSSLLELRPSDHEAILSLYRYLAPARAAVQYGVEPAPAVPVHG
jgi:hypothetical protein